MSDPAYDQEPLHAPLFEQARTLLTDLPGLLTDQVRLFSLESKRAAGALGQMAALGLLAAILAATAWVALWVGFAAGMIALGLAWPWAVLIVLAINVGAAAWCAPARQSSGSPPRASRHFAQLDRGVATEAACPGR